MMIRDGQKVYIAGPYTAYIPYIPVYTSVSVY